jgi:hypothetical protein
MKGPKSEAKVGYKEIPVGAYGFRMTCLLSKYARNLSTERT